MSSKKNRSIEPYNKATGLRPKVAILASGGIDSTVLMYRSIKEGNLTSAIGINYGALAFKEEIECMHYHADRLKIPLIIIPVEYRMWQSKSALFKEDYMPPDHDFNTLAHEDMLIEGRNMIMLGYVLAWCSLHKIDELWAGYEYELPEWDNIRSHQETTNDCSPRFVDMINLMSTVGFSHQVRFRAPFFEDRSDEEDIILEGKELGVDLSNTYSCYFVPRCGKCNSCRRRKKYMGEEI